MADLSAFPVDDVALAAIDHALGGAWRVDEEGNHTLVGADYSLDQLLDFMAGISRAEDAEHLTQIDEHVFVDDRVHYSPTDIIRALIAEVRRLRARSDLVHIGWWSEGNGWTPSYEPETEDLREWCFRQGWQPVYVKPEEKP